MEETFSRELARKYKLLLCHFVIFALTIASSSVLN